MVRTPWYAKMGAVPCHLEYQQCSMEEAVEKILDVAEWLLVERGYEHTTTI